MTFFFGRILSILTHSHKGRGEKVLKQLTVVYIQKGLSIMTYENDKYIYIYIFFFYIKKKPQLWVHECHTKLLRMIHWQKEL